MRAGAGWAAGLAAASVLVGRGGGGRVLLARARPAPSARLAGRVPDAGRAVPARHRPGALGWAWRRVPAGVAGVAAVGVAGIGLGAAVGRPLLGGVAVLFAACAARERAAAARAKAAAGEERRVREFAALTAAELRAGRSARAAVVRAARDLGVLAEPDAAAWAAAVAAAAESGEDVAAAFEAAAATPGAAALRDVAACWRVAEGTGAGLAAALDVVAAGLRDREAHRREVSAQLAGVRATGWLLAALPAFGLVLGGTLGAQPWHVLLDTGAGNAALLAGLMLDVAGLAWLGRLVRGVQR